MEPTRVCHCPARLRAHEYDAGVCPSEGPMGLPRKRPKPAVVDATCRCVFRGGPNGAPHAWNPGGNHVGDACCPEDGPIIYAKGGFVADVYGNGGKREENGDRPRFDLLWTESQPLERQMLYRDAVWYQKGAKKYGERNWERFNGQAELVRAQASLGRHNAAFMLGLTDEDHAAAIRANVQFIEYIREQLAAERKSE